MSSRRGVILLVIVLATVGLILTIASSRMSHHPRASSSSVLVWDVPSVIEEDLTPSEPFSPKFWRRPQLTLFDALETIRSASDDDHIKALVLHIRGINWGWAKIAEVRSALQEFRETGKPVMASIEGGGELEYLLASAAKPVSVPPAVQLELDGLRMSAVFLRGTFDKLGIRPNFLSIGKYKSAVETYTRTGMTDAAREAMTSLLQDDYSMLSDSLASARGTSPDSIRAWLDRGPYTAQEARSLGLIDTVLYSSDIDSLAVRRAGRGSTLLKLNRYADRAGAGGIGAHIAIVTIAGAISEGKNRFSPMDGPIAGSQTIIDALQKARNRRSIRSVVLRIDSPGGDVDAADAIWHEVVRLRRAKPVIVSMSDLAASGGYYIAMPADSVLALPGTITGSIGVFGGKFNVLGLYQKLGLNVETVVTGPRAEMLSPFSDFSPDEARIYESRMRDTYERFLKLVSDGRRMSVEAVDSVAQGRVWSGSRAAELGLVDRLGGIEDAIEVARIRAGIPKDADLVIDRYPEPESPFFQRFFSDLFSDDEDDDASALAASLDPIRQLGTAAFASRSAIWALMPYTIVVR